MRGIDLTIDRMLPSQLPTINSLKESTFIGIDFGTSTTVVSMASITPEDGHIVTEVLWIPQKATDGTEIKSPILPSVIACIENQILVGEGASSLKFDLKKGHNVWYSFKMELGADLGATYSDSVLNTDDDWNILNAKDAARVFFKYLKIKIDEIIEKNNWSKKIHYAISIPASFEANQRRDLIDCLDQNGMQINNQSLIDEPNAAFISYVWESTINNSPVRIPDYNSNVLVFDFGAGTCDISILEVGSIGKEIFSKNLSISRFEKLGGDDVDRMIALEVLMPQLFEQNNVKISDFRSKIIIREIVPKLLKAAESLKIQICKGVSILSYDFNLPEEAESDLKIDLKIDIEIQAGSKKLVLHNPYMKYNQFNELMEKFTSRDGYRFSPAIYGDDDFISIFEPIETALRKANINRVDIDNILLIGGSSKNPYVQFALKKYFSKSDLLLPTDTQIQVSRGAAIHSLVLNGLNKNIIKPITSEPILLITKSEIPKVLFPAGVEIPTDIAIFDDLCIENDYQALLELPFCIGSSNKLLFNVKISPNDGYFRKGERVKIQVEISPDKLLYINATVGNQQVIVKPVNPFTNKELTTEERIILQAEKEYNNQIALLGGADSEDALRKLYNVYNGKEAHFKAAETLEEIFEKFPWNHDFNQIGLHYNSAGFDELALKFYERAFEDAPSSAVAFNIGHQYKYIDKNKYVEYLQKALSLESKQPHSLYELGCYYKENGEIEKGEEMIEEAFSIWQSKFKSGRLTRNEYSWLISCSYEVGKDSFAREVALAEPKRQEEKGYDEDNLASKNPD